MVATLPGSPVNYSGKLYRPTFYGVEETGRIDMDKVEATAKKAPNDHLRRFRLRPRMGLRAARHRRRGWAILLADISHPGLIAAGLLDNPLPHCHVVTSTTQDPARSPR